ncbi:hypothetical protein C8F04DRAFT_1193435 [Mycena alexandri]|uniref:Uncharacterized protein n=1 Tax=Mycena alexandri TaxID=1745969 RepID=A0AAD6WSK2_9AGAR|nr:hypothetical protein C8F04DRAFT_1193435 [Mycena alexandri]
MLIHSIKLPAAISLLPTLHRITLCCANIENELNWDYLEEPSDACSDDEPPVLDEQISLEDALNDSRVGPYDLLTREHDQFGVDAEIERWDNRNIIVSQQQTSLTACLGFSMPVAAFPERAQHKISKPAVLAPKITKTGKTATASAKALSKIASAKAPSGKTPSTSVSNQPKKPENARRCDFKEARVNYNSLPVFALNPLISQHQISSQSPPPKPKKKAVPSKGSIPL